MTKSRTVPGPARFAIGMIAVALVAGIGVAFLPGSADPGALATTFAIVVAMLTATIASSIWWWVKLDEAAREAHKWAWWWGGTAGVVIGGLVLLTVMAGGDIAPVSAWAGDAPASIFGAGMVSILVFQVVGYAIAWAVWWLWRR